MAGHSGTPELKFTHESLPQRVIFDSYAAAGHVAAEVDRLGARRPMLISTGTTIEVQGAVRHTEVVMHVPVEVAERARARAAAEAVDVLVAVGGGSTTGLAKAVALTTGLPIIAVPTTYAGSEATAVWGLTDGGGKTTGTDPRVLPRVVVYDAGLTLSLPVPLSVASGLNALAHCVDSMWAPRADPINRAFALEGARALNTGLPTVFDAPSDLEGRENALYGAHLAAVAFASAGSGLHHKICHVLGGLFNLPHAPTHAVLLPYVTALNEFAAPALAAAFGTPTAVEGLLSLQKRLDAPRSLRELGLNETDLPAAVDGVLPAVPAGNPAPIDRPRLAELLHRAWEGTDPR
ncbi:maleylacetate reductase [Actinoplanes sp. NPDC049265]|uniref:maleylacetate reductase n=1 Tax=Actinoplanes sp. NPDC049265 TaxID=3363902 RepID=UPI00371F660E